MKPRRLRLVEPHSLVVAGRRWYLVAHDIDRDDWRIFRVDRIGDPRSVAGRTEARDLPAEDAAAFVRNRLYDLAPTFRAVVTLQVTAQRAASPPWRLPWRDRTARRAQLSRAARSGHAGVARLPTLADGLRVRGPRPPGARRISACTRRPGHARGGSCVIPQIGMTVIRSKMPSITVGSSCPRPGAGRSRSPPPARAGRHR